MPDDHEKGQNQFCMFLAEHIKKPKKTCNCIYIELLFGQILWGKGWMLHATWIIFIFSLLSFEWFWFFGGFFGFFPPSFFCFTLKLIYVQYLCIFSRFHLEVDVQLSCTERISHIICFKTEFGESSVLQIRARILSKPESSANQAETNMKLNSLMVPVLRDELNPAKLKKPFQLVQEFKPNTSCYHLQSSGKENALNAMPVKDVPLSFLALSYCGLFTFPKETV